MEELYGPYKKGAKGTLADRARKLGLDEVAQKVVDRPHEDVNLYNYVKKNTTEGETGYTEKIIV